MELLGMSLWVEAPPTIMEALKAPQVETFGNPWINTTETKFLPS